MKNKKGKLLVSETLKMVIAVICIGFLIYFLTSLYLGNKSSNDLEFAKESLQHLSEGLNSNLDKIEIYNPKGWVIGSWPHLFSKGKLFLKKTKEGMPKSCSNFGWSNCICICPKDNPEECDEKGICIENEFIVGEGNIKIENLPLVLIIDYENKKIVEENEL
ncbi:hypothetical protein KAR52_02745 [Candidatus Pacearchaeota archaeon]|nr:hypothetical protein [Candidatus Pacearchaeota archaeon]